MSGPDSAPPQPGDEILILQYGRLWRGACIDVAGAGRRVFCRWTEGPAWTDLDAVVGVVTIKRRAFAPRRSMGRYKGAATLRPERVED